MKAWWLSLALWLPVAAVAQTLQPLAAVDVPALVKPPTHGARILALWALDCAYCEANLDSLARLQHSRPNDIELIIVATDSIEQRAAVEARLHAMKMDAYPARAYAETSPERINFLIDPSWGGETPRVLMIRADGTRLGISGALTVAQLEKLR